MLPKAALVFVVGGGVVVEDGGRDLGRVGHDEVAASDFVFFADALDALHAAIAVGPGFYKNVIAPGVVGVVNQDADVPFAKFLIPTGQNLMIVPDLHGVFGAHVHHADGGGNAVIQVLP